LKKFFFFLFVSFALGCTSNCIECHPKLKSLENNPHNKYYKEHYFLKSCTKCHPNHPTKNMDKCGADCFDCHSRKKLINSPIPQHQKLKSCIKCHKNEEIQDLINPEGIGLIPGS